MHKMTAHICITLVSTILILCGFSGLTSAQPTTTLEINGLNLLQVIQRQQNEIEKLRENLMQLTGIRGEVLKLTEDVKNLSCPCGFGKSNVVDNTPIESKVSDKVKDLSCDFYQIFYSEVWCDRARGFFPWSSGVYPLIEGFEANFGGVTISTSVYCDFHTDGGGWGVIQRRVSGSFNFTANWKSYEDGFGSPANEYWLGLRKVHRATAAVPHELRIDFNEQPLNSTTPGRSRYAKYSSVDVKARCSNYQLILGSYSGNAGDILGRFNGSFFSTYDKDNDLVSGRNCAQELQGGWWYSSPCTSQAGNLNSPLSEMGNWGVQFDPVEGPFQIKTVEIKIRPL